MIIVTRGSTEDHLKEIEEILEILQKMGYRASFEKSKRFEKEVDWCGYRINENGIKLSLKNGGYSVDKTAELSLKFDHFLVQFSI